MAREEAPNPWLERDEDAGNDGGRASGLLGVDSATLFVDANGAGPYGSDPRKALTDGQGSGVVPGPDHGAGMSSQRNSNGSALNSPTNKDRLRLKSPGFNSEKSGSADERRPTGSEQQSETSMVCQVGGWLWFMVSGGRQCCSMRDRSKDAEAAKRASQTGRPPEYKGEIVAKGPEFPYPPTADAGGAAPMPAIQDGGSLEDGETVSANNSEAMSERKSGFSSYFFLGTQAPTDEAPMKPGNSLGSSLGGIKEEKEKESLPSPHQHHHHHGKDQKVTVKTSRSESSSSGDSLQAMSRDGRESGAMSPTMRPLSARSGSMGGGLLGEDRLSRSRSKSSVTGHSSPLASRAPASARAETVIESARAGSNRADSVYSLPDTHRDTHRDTARDTTRDTARDSTRTVEEATRSSPLGSPLVGGADSDSDELGATQPLVPRSTASMAADRLLEVQPTVSLTAPASPGRQQHHHSEASYPAMSHSPSSSSRSVPRHGEMPTQELRVRQAPSSSPFLHSGSASEIPQAHRSADWFQANLAAKNFLSQIVRGVEERRSLVPGDAPPGAQQPAQPAHAAYPPHNFSAVSSAQSLFRPQGGEAAAGDGRDDSPSRRRRWRQDNEEARPTADARFPPPSRSQAGSQVGSLAGGWRWPDWAVQFHQPCVEVFVKDEETGLDRWVLGEPQHSVVDPQGNDTFLAVEYLWDDEYYAQEFSPEHIRQPGTRITVRDLLQLQ